VCATDRSSRCRPRFEGAIERDPWVHVVDGMIEHAVPGFDHPARHHAVRGQVFRAREMDALQRGRGTAARAPTPCRRRSA
jgi:hypothetical protein